MVSDKNAKFVSLGSISLSSDAGMNRLALEAVDHKFLGQWLLGLWESGVLNEFPRTFTTGHIISLPTYPFAKERYWVPVPAFSAMSLTGKVAVERLHPLVTRNVSSLSEQCFETTLSNHAFYLQDHVMGEKHILPAVAYLEMARAAGALSLKEQSPIALEHVVWAEAIIVEKDEHLIHLGFYPKEAGVAFEVSSKHSEMTEAVVHSQGYLISSDHISLEKRFQTDS